MTRVLPALLGLVLGSCSLFVDADRDRLGPQIDIGGDCSEVETCDDGVACTNDFCDADTGQCAHEPDDEACPGEGTCDPQEGCVGPERPCGGNEDCVDDTGCSTGRCSGNHCEWDPIDGDQDGTPLCENDCDDARADVHPGLPEACGNGADDDCNGATDGDDPACQGGSCGTALIIRAAGNVEGDVGGQSASNSNRCDNGIGPEAVVELVLEHDSDVIVSTEGSDFDTILYVRQGCAGEEIGCSDNRSVARSWLDSRLFLMALPAGTYTIVVDSNARAGHFRLRVDSDNPRPPTCDRPLDITGGGTVIGSTEGAEVEHDASCSDPSGPAAVMQFEQDVAGPVLVYSDESAVDLVQDIQSEQCGGTTPPEACIDRLQTGERFEAFLEDGGWIILLDGFAGASGRYVLRYFP